jgi:hypothetical protein
MKSGNFIIARIFYLLVFLLAFSTAAQTTKPPTEAQTNKIEGWYEHRSKDFRIPLLPGWSWQPDVVKKNYDLIISPGEELGIFVEEGFVDLTDETDEAALDRLANSAVKEVPNIASITSTKVGTAKAVRLYVYEREEDFPIWVYYFVHERRVYYIFIMAAPGTGNIEFPQTLTEMFNRVEFLRKAGQLNSPTK